MDTSPKRNSFRLAPQTDPAKPEGYAPQAVRQHGLPGTSLGLQLAAGVHTPLGVSVGPLLPAVVKAAMTVPYYAPRGKYQDKGKHGRSKISAKKMS